MARTKSAGHFQLDLVSGICIYMSLAAISRIIFSIFDFVLTGFNTDLYVQYVIYWKAGMFLSQIGVVMLLLLIDKSFFNFRMKGIIAYIVAIGIAFQMFYPVKIKADFDFVSSLTVIIVAGAALIPIMFFVVGHRNPEIKKDAYQIAIGIILYSLAAIVLIESILAPLTEQYGNIVQVVAFAIATIFKIVGLILIYRGTSTFKS